MARLTTSGQLPQSVTVAYRASCPSCDRAMVLDEGVKAGDFIECCGRVYRLTFGYGAFAAEQPNELEP